MQSTLVLEAEPLEEARCGGYAYRRQEPLAKPLVAE
jgi:hypothetical protein